jgi:hypothetical protein
MSDGSPERGLVWLLIAIMEYREQEERRNDAESDGGKSARHSDAVVGLHYLTRSSPATSAETELCRECKV